jgi:hypothetical protein
VRLKEGKGTAAKQQSRLFFYGLFDKRLGSQNSQDQVLFEQ